MSLLSWQQFDWGYLSCTAKHIIHLQFRSKYKFPGENKDSTAHNSMDLIKDSVLSILKTNNSYAIGMEQ